MLGAHFAELVSVLILKSWVVPFSLRFQKQSERVAPNKIISYISRIKSLDMHIETYPMCTLLWTELKTPGCRGLISV